VVVGFSVLTMGAADLNEVLVSDLLEGGLVLTEEGQFNVN
jgi:hypothetical protein